MMKSSHVWLRRVEGELYRLRHEPKRAHSRRSRLTVEQLRAQLDEEWAGTLDE